MNKIIVLFAVLAMTGCAEATGNVSLIGGGAAQGGNGGGEVSGPPARFVARDATPREIAPRHGHHREAEFVVCAQCRR